MTEVYREIIEGEGAWTPSEIGGKQGLQLWLSPEHLLAVNDLLEKTRHLAPHKITKDAYENPVLAGHCNELRRTIMDGRGLAIISGLSAEQYSEEDFQRIFFWFGSHLGVAAEQNQNGDYISFVQKEDNPNARGYRGDNELTPHTDSFELAGLMCVRRAESGGVSGVASALTVHNEILRLRPDLLDPLYEGFQYAMPELSTSSRPITDLKIPIFCSVDGVVSCMIIEQHMHNAAKALGVEFPKDLDEALEFFRSVVTRPDVSMSFLLDPGDMMWLNNFTMVHSRTQFTNSAAHQRLLLRLWLNVPHGRPVAPGLHARARAYEWHFAEKKRLRQSA